MARVVVLGLRYPDLSVEKGILGGVEVVAGSGASADEIVEQAGDADVIIAGSLPKFGSSVLERIGCRSIVRAGIGVDNIDVDAAVDLGYTLAYVPDYGTESVAQHTLALALAATRRLGEADRVVREGGWGFAELRPMKLPPASTAGVVGFGRIGRRVAELFRGIGFGRILVHDAFVEVDDQEQVGLGRLLESSDVVTLHAPPPSSGTPLIGAMEIARMRRGSAIVNTARGSLIDPAALASGLKIGAPRVAALDVFDPEPPDLTPFKDVASRLILSPHSAWYSEESQLDLRKKSAEEARRIIAGQPVRNPVSKGAS